MSTKTKESAALKRLEQAVMIAQMPGVPDEALGGLLRLAVAGTTPDLAQRLTLTRPSARHRSRRS